MFEKLEDQPRHPSGQLYNPWTQIAAHAMIIARVYVNAEITKIKALHAMTAAQVQVLTPALRPVQGLMRERLIDAVTKDAFTDATADQASNPYTDLTIAQKLIQLGRWGKEGNQK